MSSAIRSEIDVPDDLEYSLVDYRHGHSYAVVRGFPEMDDDLPGGSPVQVVDLFFAGVERISCWKDLGPVQIRRADEMQRADLEQRIGRIRSSSTVFLLERGSVDSYIIASRMYWAEFSLTYGAVSPLASEDAGYRASNPPVDGVVRFAD